MLWYALFMGLLAIVTALHVLLAFTEAAPDA